MPQAARLTDPIGHEQTGLGMIAGALVGAAVAAVGVAAVVGTGGLAAPALLAGAAALGLGISGGAGLGAMLAGMSWAPKEITGAIAAGSPDVLVNGLPLGRAHPDIVVCGKHGPTPPVIATGSDSVIVNGLPAARVDDMISCSAVIVSGSPNVIIGGGTLQTDVILPDDSVPSWVHYTLMGVGLASAAVLAGPVVALVGAIGGFAGGEAGAALGGAAFGEGSDGQKWAMLAGGMLGGLVAGRFGAARKPHAPKVPSKAVPDRFKACKKTCGDPVDIATGEVYVDQLDFSLRGALPLAWNRRYASGSTRRGVCGVGWETPADARLELGDDGSAQFFDGITAGAAIFPALPFHGPVRELSAGAMLTRELDHLVVTQPGGRRFVFAFPERGDRELRIERIEDASGNALAFVREGEHHDLRAIVESCGRRIVATSESGLLRELRLEREDPRIATSRACSCATCTTRTTTWSPRAIPTATPTASTIRITA